MSLIHQSAVPYVMGKKKVELNYMIDEKKMKRTFNFRKAGLIKKLHQLATLCNVKVIYDRVATR